MEEAAYPGAAVSGVLLAAVEEWERPVPMAAVVRLIDPNESNPLVQANGVETSLRRRRPPA